MNSLEKFFDLCKYAKLDKEANSSDIYQSDKEKELVIEMHRIYRDNNVPFEVYKKIITELDALFKRMNEKYDE